MCYLQTTHIPYIIALKVSKEDILWDEQITKIDGSIEHVKEVDPYSPNTDLHWSQISAVNDRHIVELPYCNKFESFHSGVNFFNENNLGEVFEDKVRYQLEKSDVFSVSVQKLTFELNQIEFDLVNFIIGINSNFE